MGKRVDETQDDAQEIDLLSSPAIEAEARESKPVEAATPEADGDDEYEMVELSELVEVPKAGNADIGDTPAFEAGAMDPGPPPEAVPTELVAARPPERVPSRPSPLPRHSRDLLPPPVRVTKSLPTSSASIPPPPRVPSRTLPPPPPAPVWESSASLPASPRDSSSSPPDFTISGTVPPLLKPTKNRFERALSGRQAAAAAVLAAICATGYFATKRGEGTKSEPSREVAAANLPANPQAPPPTVAAEPAADPTNAATANPKSGSEALTAAPTERPKTRSESSPAERPKTATAPIAAKTEAPRAETRETEVPKAGPQKSPSNPAACTLNLNTIPASRVAIDGRDLGMTPQIGISVQPGTHVVIFANEGGKKVTSAQCKAGEQKTVVVRLPI